MRIISKALVRQNFILGAEPELVGCLAILCGSVVFANTNVLNIFFTSIVWFIGVFFLRRLAKIDPIYFKVYQRYLGYQKFYLAKTSVWRNGNGYKAK